MKKSKTLKYSAGDEKPAMRIDKKNVHAWTVYDHKCNCNATIRFKL